MRTDSIYLEKENIDDFSFDEKVSFVFDDMVSRSVPLYNDAQDLIVDFVEKHIEPNASIYDLGCATGNTIIKLQDSLQNYHKIYGIDVSDPMLEIAREKININKLDNIILENKDICDFKPTEEAGCFILNLTLQFVRPAERQKLISKLYENTKSNGLIVLFEKIVDEDAFTNRLYIDLYYDFKRKQAYSEKEINHKRKELENVLIPYTENENKEMLMNAGFKNVSTVFRYINFAIFVGFKNN